MDAIKTDRLISKEQSVMMGWILWLALGAGVSQVVMGCEADCPEGYVKICVDRDENCKCSCVENAADGRATLGLLLKESGVSSDVSVEPGERYEQKIETGDEASSFELPFQDQDGHHLKLRVATVRTELFPPGSREALALELYRASGPSEEDMRWMMRDMLIASSPDEPVELWDQLISQLDFFNELAMRLAPLYAKHLTDDEMRQVIDFYRSPAGQKFVAAQAPIQMESMEVINGWMVPRITEILEQALSSGEVGSGPLHDSHSLRDTVAALRNVGTGMLSWLTDRVTEGPHDFTTDDPNPEIWTLVKGDKQTTYRRVSHADLVDLLVPHYLPSLPETDGWGHPLEYAVNEDLLSPVVVGIRSPGRDGIFEGTTYEIGPYPMDESDHDVVWVDGYFARWPESN